MEEKTVSVIFEGFAAYRKNFKKMLGLSVPFFMVVVIAIVLATIFPLTLVFTLPFLVIPFAFAYVVALTQVVSEHPMAFNDYYRYIVLGLSPFVRRMMHPFLTLLKMLLLMCVATLTVSVLASLLAPSLDPRLAILLDELTELTATAASMDELLAFIETNQAAFYPLFNVTLLSTTFVGMAYLLLSFSLKIPAFFLAVGLPNVFPQLDRIHQTVFRAERRQFTASLFKYQWISFTVLTMGFVLGATVGWMLGFSSLIVSLLAPLGAVLLWVVLIPHYFLVLGSIYSQLENHYVHEAQGEIQAFLKELERINELNEEQKQAIRDELTKHLEKTPVEEKTPPTDPE
ncbi:MAG: hypothetical protein WC399_02005 [Bacilli bacterium]|jgi:hypothetical protein